MEKIVTETVVKDIIDVLSDAKGTVDDFRKSARANDFKSLSSKTAGLTLIFPMITSRNVPIAIATMACKAQERQAVSMLQLLFAAVNFNSAKDGFDYIKQFHGNLNTEKLDMDGFIGAVDKLASYSESSGIPYNTYEQVKEDLRKMDCYFEVDFSESAINDFKIKEDMYGYKIITERIAERIDTVKWKDNKTPTSYRYRADEELNHITKNTNGSANKVYRGNYIYNLNNKKVHDDLYQPPLMDPFNQDPSTINPYIDPQGKPNMDLFDADIKTYNASLKREEIMNGRYRNDLTVDSNDETKRHNTKLELDTERRYNIDKKYKEKTSAETERANKEREKAELNKYNLERDRFSKDIENKDRDFKYKQKYDDNLMQFNLDKLNTEKEDLKRKAERDDWLDRRERITHQLLDNDVKKANELVPSLMTVQFNQIVTGENGESTVAKTQMLIGVKAKVYAVSSSEIINRIITKNSDRHGLIKLIRASTREIGFMKDFLFAIDKAKIDAINQSKQGTSARIFKLLERRKNIYSFKRRFGLSASDVAPISTFHISIEEVELIKKMANIDVTDPRVIRPIMYAYSLMCFCYSDVTTESISFIYDSGDDSYETISFSSLERESGENSRKLINLMTKINR